MVKYLWVSTTKKRSADEKQELVSWLATQSSCGLGEQIKGVFYIRASTSCVGKDYRFIAQISPLVAYLLQQRMWLSQSEAECWMALGKLTRHAMRTDTDDLAAYADTKVKYHYLLHLEEAIWRFGLPRMFDSSVAESANKTVRDYCMHSNRHSPIRDIACQDSQAHHLVFIAAGGRWDAADGPQGHRRPLCFAILSRRRKGATFDANYGWTIGKIRRSTIDTCIVGWLWATRRLLWRLRRRSTPPERVPRFIIVFLNALGTTPSLRPGRFVTLRNGDYCWSRDWCFVQAGSQDQRILELWTVDGRPPEVISPFGLSFVVLAFAAVGEELGDTGFLKIQRTEEIEVMPLEPPGRFSWRWPSFSTIALDLALWALGEGVRPIFAEGQYTRRIARGVVHDNDRNFLLSTINYRSYDIVDLFAPLPIPPQESDEFLEGPSAKSTISYDRPGESNFPIGSAIACTDTQGYKSWSQRACINLRADVLWDVVNQSLDSLIADYRSTLVNTAYAPASLPVGITTSSIRSLRNTCQEVGFA
ncbi:BQ5605_C021g09268 [Microbotryum silenes-dioicae]|uniref:BQ5605_C021g09268 protein n=1 Tax=Microbotryum silenes-dioicae TaxID=796604 RepID=A0A2X0MNZ8_9BASI|nr:BQ5605_C021g09268 [Microbotryum silenes-dioicae]